MRILLICEAVFPENKGGLERWMVWLANELHRRGNLVFYFNASGVNEVREGVTYKSITNKSWSYTKKNNRSILQSIEFSRKLFMQLRKADYEVIYSAQAPVISLLFIQMANLRPNKSLLIIDWLEIWSYSYWREYLGSIFGLLGYLIQTLALRVGEIKVCYTDRVYIKLKSVNKRSQIYKLPGICMDDNPKFPLSFEQKNNIIFLSRFVKDKNPLLAIDAVVEYKKLGWDGVFFLIGSGPMESKIREYVNHKGATNFIKVLVSIPDSEVMEIMKSSFVLLHTSMREGFGLSMVEAACQGVPTILINYPENVSVDLAIVEELVSQTPTVSELVGKLQRAYCNQRIYYEKLKIWVETKYPQMLGSKSLNYLENIIKNNYDTAYSSRKKQNTYE
jgi:glycosyltransferase involved in cell wall biosynthesis